MGKKQKIREGRMCKQCKEVKPEAAFLKIASPG